MIIIEKNESIWEKPGEYKERVRGGKGSREMSPYYNFKTL